MHNSTKTRSLRVFSVLSRMVVNLAKEFDLHLEYIDIGGGFWGGKITPGKPTMKEYANTIATELKAWFDPYEVTLIVEPGASVIATAVDYVTDVSNIREVRGEKIVTLNGTLLHINPFMTKRNHSFNVENVDPNAVRVPVQHVCGCTCMEMDRFCSLYEEYEVSDNNRFIFHDAGAYTMAFNSNFIVDPPMVYIIEE